MGEIGLSCRSRLLERMDLLAGALKRIGATRLSMLGGGALGLLLAYYHTVKEDRARLRGGSASFVWVELYKDLVRCHSSPHFGITGC